MRNLLPLEWQRRLELAQSNPSWRAQLEARVLRFLLRRYVEVSEMTPVPDRPLWRGPLPHGRAKMVLSPEQQRQRLQHLAAEGSEAQAEPITVSGRKIEEAAWSELERRRKQQEQCRNRQERRRKRRERGYW
ncbi:MAG: hypothetical protein KY445_14110 [Armatimonadetes bacterium]|nr:hypothetical protein [Armatimonadota bacterium]